MIKIFISYAHEDEKYKDELAKHMSVLVRQGILETWDDRKIDAGDEWDKAIKSKLDQANIILFLVSKNFIASDYINDVEIKNAITRQEKGDARILTIYINHCYFEGSPICEFPMHPKGDKPILGWKNQAEAWLQVIHGLLQTIADIQGKNSNHLIAKYNIDSRKDAKKIVDKYNLRTPEGQIEIGGKIKNMGLEGPMGNHHLVNINREVSKNNWWDAYDEKVNHKDFFQFYFLTACSTQMPSRFAERMIYEVIAEELDDSTEAIHYKTIKGEDNGRVDSEDLPMKRNLEKTKEAFKKYFCERFDFQDTSFDLQKFIQQGVPRLEYQYVVSVFKMPPLSKWKDFLADFFDWVVDTFKNEHEDLPTFIFFFVMIIENAHLPEALSEKEKNVISILENIASSHSNSTLFRKFNPVKGEDVKLWFNELGEENPEKIDDVVDSFVRGLEPKRQEIYEKKKILDMSVVEILQEFVFKIINR